MEDQSQKKSHHTHVENLNMIKVTFHFCRGKMDYNSMFTAALFIKKKKIKNNLNVHKYELI